MAICKAVIVFNKKGHLIIGLLGGIALLMFYTLTPVSLIFILLGSLIPDIDHKKSTLGRYNPFVRFMKHRGKCHTIIGCMLLATPFILISVTAFLSVFYGAILHIVGDKIYSWTGKNRRRFYIRIW